MTTSEEDRKAAEEWCQNKFGHTHTKFGGEDEFTPNPCIEAFLEGVKYANKFLRIVNIQHIEGLPDLDKLMPVESRKVGWPLSPAPTPSPVEQLGERYWRIKDDPASIPMSTLINYINAMESEIKDGHE